MYILGINAFHGDSSACLLKDGVVINATEEERFRRIKHWAGFPSEAIKFCLQEAEISVKELDFVTISRNPKANLSKKVIHTLRNKVGFKTIFDEEISSQETIEFYGAEKSKTMGPSISVYVDDELNAEYVTSCGEPNTVPGLISGDFEVVRGYSRNGGLLCP